MIPLLLLACASDSGAGSDSAPVRLTLTGSSTVAPLVSELAKRYESQNPGARIDVQTGGSSRGVADAASGTADIGMASRAQKQDDPADLVFTPIAQDGIALIVHAENPVAELSREQVVSIYTGGIASWLDLGGADLPITVVNKAEGRSTLELFCHFFKLEAAAIKASVVIGDNAQGIKTVAGNPGAIGYVSIGTAEYERDHGTPIKLLPLDGVAPSVASVKDGSFPMSRPLNLVTRGQPAGAVADFIGFARDAAQHDLVAGQYFVPVD